MKTMITSSQELYRLESAYKENLPGLLAYARRFVPEDVAGDLVQDVFVRLWQSSRAFLNVPEGQTRQAYLFRSVRNACKDWLKHQLAVSRYEGETLYLMKQEEIDFSSRRTPREQEAL
ncbi:MAG: RNA polymerase sigma-70 factor, partial [Bacteroidales bacterium]|nr:RNA polymerase sigma-70 factor [Bacteroidales bacterium]